MWLRDPFQPDNAAQVLVQPKGEVHVGGMDVVNAMTIEVVRRGQEWSALELAVLEACRTGEVAVLPDKADRPEDIKDADRRVRPGLIRYLMLGGCASKSEYSRRPHSKGVHIKGGWLDGPLDLVSCDSPVI